MDISVEYTLMCKRAKELQDNWTSGNIGDHIIDGRGYHYVFGDARIDQEHNVFVLNKMAKKFGVKISNITWLPRQDQLQKIADDFIGDISGRTGAFYNLYNFVQQIKSVSFSEFEDYWTKIKSMEQLWLSFVMNSKYTKQWNGKEWISGGKNAG